MLTFARKARLIIITVRIRISITMQKQFELVIETPSVAIQNSVIYYYIDVTLVQVALTMSTALNSCYTVYTGEGDESNIISRSLDWLP